MCNLKGLFIDPGTRVSGWIIWDGEKCYERGLDANKDIKEMILSSKNQIDYMGIEKFENRSGMNFAKGNKFIAAGSEDFHWAIFWMGIFCATVESVNIPWEFIIRKEVKLHLTYSITASDSDIHAAIIEKLGKKSTKKFNNEMLQDKIYGSITEDIWQALGLGLYYTGTGRHTKFIRPSGH